MDRDEILYDDINEYGDGIDLSEEDELVYMLSNNNKTNECQRFDYEDIAFFRDNWPSKEYYRPSNPTSTQLPHVSSNDRSKLRRKHDDMMTNDQSEDENHQNEMKYTEQRLYSDTNSQYGNDEYQRYGRDNNQDDQDDDEEDRNNQHHHIDRQQNKETPKRRCNVKSQGISPKEIENISPINEEFESDHLDFQYRHNRGDQDDDEIQNQQISCRRIKKTRL